MGRVRTKTVKRAAHQLIEKHYQKMSNDFHYNKRVLDEVAIVPSKRLRNKIAGYATHLVKRIQKGPVRGISLKLQEQEREKRMETAPNPEEFADYSTKIDSATFRMLNELGLGHLFKKSKK